MTTTSSPFGDIPFSLREGLDAGLGRGALAGRRFDRPFPGVRQWSSGEPVVDPRERVLQLCRQFEVRMTAMQFFSHDTALALLGAPMPLADRPVLHVSAYRPAREPRVAGVVGHRLQQRPSAATAVARLRVEHPARAWVQVSRAWSTDDLIIAGDFLVARRRRLATVDDLRAEASIMRRATSLGPVLDAIRDGSESSEETRLRLVLMRQGLPEPELNIDLRDPTGRFIARMDQSYPRFRVAVEYDGRWHATDIGQFQRDGDRWDAIRGQGWQLVRVMRHHMRDDGRPAAAKVREALWRAGWRP